MFLFTNFWFTNLLRPFFSICYLLEIIILYYNVFEIFSNDDTKERYGIYTICLHPFQSLTEKSTVFVEYFRASEVFYLIC